jgi:hypothetical protein
MEFLLWVLLGISWNSMVDFPADFPKQFPAD